MKVKQLMRILSTYTPDTDVWVEATGNCVNDAHLLTKIELCKDGLYEYNNGEFVKIPDGHSGVAIIQASTTKKHKCILCQ